MLLNSGLTVSAKLLWKRQERTRWSGKERSVKKRAVGEKGRLKKQYIGAERL